jgi:DNA-damage-inducible protein D
MSEIAKYEDSEQPSFEDFKNENGLTYWWASDLMKMLDYKDMKSFSNVLNRAMKTCLTLGINQFENFIPETREVKGAMISDYRLTRFACYLTVMNGDTKKPSVASAQVYFVTQTRKFELSLQTSEDLDRLNFRDEIKEGNKSLSSTAQRAGVTDYTKFVNAGYLGLYNMYNWQLAKRRGVDKKNLMEYIGRAELAANLFRITQTEERIKNYNIKGQYSLEKTHYDVGREVRDLVQKNTGKSPEQLPMGKNIPEVQKELKKGYKKMIEEDKKKKKKK